MTPPPMETITMQFRKGSSDKVYQATIEPANELFAVHFAYRAARMHPGPGEVPAGRSGAGMSVLLTRVRPRSSPAKTLT